MNIQIETTNKCQCACTFCLRSIETPTNPGIIDDEVFKKIVLSSKEMNMQNFYLTGLGDPFFDIKLEDRIKFVKRHHRKSSICIYTNGIIANRKRLIKCVNNGLDNIVFSLNSLTSEMHSQIMGVDNKLDVVIENIDYALSISGLKVTISVVLGTKYLEVGEYEKIVERYLPDNIYGHTAGNWAGKVFKIDYVPLSNRCRWFKEQMYFNLEGDMCLCCFDPYGKFSFGNIKNTSVRDLWFGEKRKMFLRRLEQEGRRGVIPCKGCTTI